MIVLEEKLLVQGVHFNTISGHYINVTPQPSAVCGGPGFPSGAGHMGHQMEFWEKLFLKPKVVKGVTTPTRAESERISTSNSSFCFCDKINISTISNTLCACLLCVFIYFYLTLCLWVSPYGYKVYLKIYIFPSTDVWEECLSMSRVCVQLSVMDDCVSAVALSTEPGECVRGRPRPSLSDTLSLPLSQH